MGLIDEWATRFFQELDYDREAQNAITFKRQMAHLGGITVAEVNPSLTNHEVLTTAWVQGELLCSQMVQVVSWSAFSCMHVWRKLPVLYLCNILGSACATRK